MRQIIGRRMHELTRTDAARLRDRYDDVVLDLAPAGA
jgi:hypothetical protein